MKLQTAVTADRAPLVELSNWSKATVNSVLLFRGVYFIQPNPSHEISDRGSSACFFLWKSVQVIKVFSLVCGNV